MSVFVSNENDAVQAVLGHSEAQLDLQQAVDSLRAAEQTAERDADAARQHINELASTLQAWCQLDASTGPAGPYDDGGGMREELSLPGAVTLLDARLIEISRQAEDFCAAWDRAVRAVEARRAEAARLVERTAAEERARAEKAERDAKKAAEEEKTRRASRRDGAVLLLVLAVILLVPAWLADKISEGAGALPRAGAFVLAAIGLYRLVTALSASNAPTPSPSPAAGPPETRPAAWLPDPTQRAQLRYWDGREWTSHVSDDGVQRTDPIG